MVSIQTLKRKRDNRVDLEGTPPAIFLNTGDIAVDTNNGGWVIDFTEETKTRKLSPYSIISVNNKSGSDLNIYVNQRKDWQKTVRSGGETQRITDFPGIRSVRISKRNSSVTISAGEVEVNVERAPLTDDEFRRREHKQNFLSKFIKNKLGF